MYERSFGFRAGAGGLSSCARGEIPDTVNRC